MNKKIFGIKIGPLLVALVCLLVAVVIWMFVKYNMNLQGINELFALLHPLC